MDVGSDRWRDLIRGAAASLAIPVEKKCLEQFSLHARELMRWGRKINLTAITDPREIAVKHYVDAMAPVPLLRPGERTLDIGSGGGFPGLVLKIMVPSLRVTLIDASRKKVNFLNHVIRTLGLRGIDARHVRAGDLARNPGSPGAYDVIVSRALGTLDRFAEMAQPLLACQGRIIAYKGKPDSGETSDLETVLARMRHADPATIRAYRIRTIHYRLPVLDADRSLVVVDLEKCHSEMGIRP